tara:strand:- start:4935 stop:5198 length:264 start_codon:yes stop_codon:yes gene_type:complete
MGLCYFCDEKQRTTWSGYFCDTCSEILAICKVYKTEKVLGVLELLLIRDDEKLKICLDKNKKKKNEEIEKMDDSTYQLRSKDPLPPL